MNWESLYRIVEEARKLDPALRDAFLKAECTDDDELLETAQSLLSIGVEEDFINPPFEDPAQSFGGGLDGRVFGEFLLISEIARGGMGVIYKGIQKGLNRPVAVKILPRIQRSNAEVFERFQREAQAASKVQHPHAVPVLAAGDTGGIAWFAMPLVEGHDLATELNSQREGKASAIWPAFVRGDYVAHAAAQIAGVAEALQHIHEQGIIHRDIKPRNLLLNLQGQLSVVDFGLAKVMELETITEVGAVQGTPYYMSPEQARAMKHPVDFRTDVYSLSVVLFEMLSLKRPYDGDSFNDIIGKIASGTHLSLRKANPRTPRDLITICEKGMSLLPSNRYTTAGELAEDLRRFSRFEAITARPAPWRYRLYRYYRGNRKVVTAALLAIALAAGWFGASRWQAKRIKLANWNVALTAVLEPNPAVEEFRQAARALSELQANGTVPSSLGKVHTEAAAILKAEEQRRLEVIRESYSKGKGVGTFEAFGETFLQPKQTQPLIEGLLFAQESYTTFPDNAELAEASGFQAILPKLSFSLSPRSAPAAFNSEAIVRAYLMDPISYIYGPATVLGTTPIESQAIAPGEWRFTVEAPGVGFGEYDRYISWDDDRIEISATILETPEVAQVMTLIQPVGGEFPTDNLPATDTQENHGYHEGPVPLDNYWIDTAAVSNGEYFEFVRLTGIAPPMPWQLASEDIEFNGDWRSLPVEDVGDLWLRLPVTGVAILHAQSFAEFHGKRLVSHYEMEYAARGSDMRLYPWGNGVQPVGFLANVDRGKLPPRKNWRERYRQWLGMILPVNASGHQHPPFGLFHTYGNIAYATWGPSVKRQGQRLVLNPAERFVFGVSATDPLQSFPEADHDIQGWTQSTFFN